MMRLPTMLATAAAAAAAATMLPAAASAPQWAAAAAAEAGKGPQVQLDCGSTVQGSKAAAPFEGVSAFEGLRYAKKPQRFAPPQDMECDGGDTIDATAPGSMCAQLATIGFSLPYSTMNAKVLPHMVYVLPLLTSLFGLAAGCTAARAAWAFDKTGAV